MPIVFRWEQVSIVDEFGEISRVWVMLPLKRYQNLACGQFVEHEEYYLTAEEVRSAKQHRFYMASIKDGFDNLPENVATRFPSPTHLRKWLLVRCGFFVEKEFEFDGRNAEIQARRLGTFIRTTDEYAVISPVEIEPGKWKVIVRQAKSQAASGPNRMPAEEFKASSKAVLEALDDMIGVERGTLEKQGRQNA